MSEALLNDSSVIRRWLKWTAVACVGVVATLAALAAALDVGVLNGVLIRVLEVHFRRQIHVEGHLRLRVFSLNPEVTAERVTIGNPPWMPAGTLAEVGKLAVVLAVPGPRHWFGIERLELNSALLHLVRDSAGHANWQHSEQVQGGKGLPIIRSLSMPDARVTLDDDRHHLQFEGTVSAGEIRESGALPRLRIAGAGQLNGRRVDLEITGDALGTASHAVPYHFTFSEQGSGSRITGHGFLPRPFDFSVLDTSFDARGEDLKDLYLLTGVKLVNTGPYRLSGALARRGTLTEFSDLAVTSGQSDLHGTVTIDLSSGRRKLKADVTSQLLRVADLGLRAAGREPQPDTGPRLLLSDTRLNAAALRRGDSVVTWHARRVEVGRVPLTSAAANVTVEGGVLNVAPLTANVLDGKLSARLKIDATTDLPAADLEVKIDDLQLARLAELRGKTPATPAVEGQLRARIMLAGRGSSAHQVAAGANGTVTAVLPHGTVRAALAELAGLDLRGLGLMIADKSQDTAIRCGVASFRAHAGVLTAESLVIDTDPVLIVGSGQINLDSEAIDLVFQGEPKRLRLLRLRSPLLLRGTLAHPQIGIEGGKSPVQAAAAVALGVVVAPLAAALAFVDPGLAKDADCAALIGQAGGA